MNRIFNPKSHYAVFIGFVLISAIVAIAFRQTLGDRWGYHAHRNRLQSVHYQFARELSPKLTPFSPLEEHITYQELMIAAGKRRHLARRYADRAEKNPSSAAMQALYARVANHPRRKENALKKAQSLSPDDPAVRFITIENLVEKGFNLQAMTSLNKPGSRSWLWWSLEAQAAWALGYNQHAFNAFQQALNDKDLPSASLYAQISPPSLLGVQLTYYQFLSEQDQETLNSFPRIPPVRSDTFTLVDAYQVLNSGASEKNGEGSASPQMDSIQYDPDVLNVHARAAMKRGDFERARTLLARSLRIHPRQPAALVYQGIISLSKGDRDSAKKRFSYGLDSKSRRFDSKFHSRMGHLLTLENQPDYAFKHYIKAHGTVPDNLILLKKLAGEYKKNMKFDLAEETYHRAYLLKQKDAEILNGLSDIYLFLNDKDRLIQITGELLDVDIHNHAVRKRLADLYLDQGNVNRAIGFYDSYIHRFPEKSARSYAEIARIHIRKGDLSKAERIINNTLNKNRNMEGKEELLKALNEIEIAKSASSK